MRRGGEPAPPGHAAPEINSHRPGAHPIGTDGTGNPRQSRDLPIVAAVAVPPIGRLRRLWMLWAASCCYCGYAHLHRAGSPVGAREAGCGKGSYYVRVVREQRPEAAA